MSWDPLRDILNIQEQVNKVFKDTFQSGTVAGEWAPPVDIYETDSELVIFVELPGVPEDSINIEIKNSILEISGEKLSPIDAEKDNYYRLERTFGKFRRTFSLPATVDTENVSAEIRDGILKIVVQKDLGKGIKTIKVTKG